MENLMPADAFTVINKTILRDSERQIITLLYQPIIGSIASSLYFTLWGFLDKNEILSVEISHHHLMSVMHVDLNNIEIARKKLEAIGLLKTFFIEDEIGRYVYEIYSPVEPLEFFLNPILNTGLYNNIGKSEYDRIVSFYQTPNINLNNYKDITSSFGDTFEVVSLLPIEILSSDIKKFNYQKLKINSGVDVEEVLKSIPQELINHKLINKGVKDYLHKLSFIYDLDNKILANLIEESMNERKLIDIELLKTNSEKYFKFENKGKMPSLAYKEQPEYLRNKATGLSNKEKMIHFFETTSPADFLKLKNNSDTLSKGERDILAYLLLEQSMNPGVVNVLIDYVLKINDNKLYRNFIETIASHWKRNNIETVVDAMELALQENSKKKEYKPQVKKEEKAPEWINKEMELMEDPEALNRLNELLKGFE